MDKSTEGKKGEIDGGCLKGNEENGKEMGRGRNERGVEGKRKWGGGEEQEMVWGLCRWVEN